jgi:hypothetical protein
MPSKHRRVVSTIATLGRIRAHKRTGNKTFQLEMYKTNKLDADGSQLPGAVILWTDPRDVPLETLEKALRNTNTAYEKAINGDSWWSAHEEDLWMALDCLYRELARRADKVQSKTHVPT